ncbi:MAG: PKD domain-containing protein, partial [Candidatus Manganitrophaceae bacterium]
VPGGADTVGNQRGKYGPEVWWYQACGSHGCGIVGGGANDSQGYHLDWPSYMIDLPAMFNRIMQWQSFKYNIQGELYYDMVYAFGEADAWRSQYYFGGNGDGTLYYPGKPSKIGGTKHIPIESIRLKLLREGMEDYEYMNLLKTLGEESFAQEQVARLVTNTYTWDREPLDLYDAREKMAEEITRNHPGAGGNGGGESTGLGSLPGGEPAPGNTRPNAALTINADPQDPWLFSFDGSASSDAEGAIASYSWGFGDGATASDPQTTHRYAKAGSYNVTLTVRDAAGISETISVAISVTGEQGSPMAQWFAESASGGALHYTFDGSKSIGGDGSLTTYEWDMGDQTVKTGAKVEHQYRRPGSYPVKLTVRNDKQKSATATYTLKVGSSSQASGGGGGGGGCSLVRNAGPTDFRQAIPFLLILSSPFWGSTWRKLRKRTG